MNSRGSAAKGALAAVVLAAALGAAMAWRFGRPGGESAPALPPSAPHAADAPPVAPPGPKPPTGVKPPPTTLFGKVLDAKGNPVCGARFFFLPELNDGESYFQRVEGTSDVDGDYDLRAGSFLMAAWAPGSGMAVVDLTGAATGRRDISLPAADRILRGRVRDAEGHPVKGATVSISWVSAKSTQGESQLSFVGPDGGTLGNADLFAWGAFPPSEKPPSTATADDGTFELKGLPEGLGIRVDAKGFEASNAPLPASGDLDVTLRRAE